MEATRITATELARNLSDILNRVKYRGESFIVERGGETVAMLTPDSSEEPKKIMTFGEFLQWWPTLPKPDPGFWDDVEWARKNQPPLPEPPSWD